MWLAESSSRVEQHTAPEVNKQVMRDIEKNVAWHASAGEESINQRLRELDQEWDIERALETLASGFSLVGFVLAVGNRKWLMLPAVVGTFMLMHGLQGWCPPLPVVRRLGFRTRSEIDKERFALKAVRGDFNALPPATIPVSNQDLGRILHAWS